MADMRRRRSMRNMKKEVSRSSGAGTGTGTTRSKKKMEERRISPFEALGSRAHLLRVDHRTTLAKKEKKKKKERKNNWRIGGPGPPVTTSC